MYSSCLFCHAELGRNESVEHFPVGRRLAFDAANGRLWVICPSCKRWNLTPLEERWDAIDECERLFEGTRLRMSTDNIGLARISEGTELVRVGTALRPEMAAWRFGAQLAARRRQYRWVVAGGTLATVGLFVGVKTAGLGLVGGNWGWSLVKGAYERATRLVLPAPTDRLVEPGLLNRDLFQVVGLAPSRTDAPRIETKHARLGRFRAASADGSPELIVPVVGGEEVRYAPEAALRVLPKLLAKVNRSGGRQEEERMAVGMLAAAGARGQPDLFRNVVDQYATKTLREKPLGKLGTATSLALEMALNEDRERVALAGELIDLEFAWQEAEELARIADSLGSSAIDRALASLKARMSG